MDALGALEGPWGRHWRNYPLHGSPFGSISASFFDEMRIISPVFFDCFSGCLFYRFLTVLGMFFRGFLSVFLVIFWNCELVNICTTHRRQLDFQGLAGFGSACFVLFFGVSFLDGFGNECLMISGVFFGFFLSVF